MTKRIQLLGIIGLMLVMAEALAGVPSEKQALDRAWRSSEKIQDTALKALTKHAIVSQWCRIDPGKAAGMALNLKMRCTREDSLILAVSAWTRKDAKAATAWAEALEDQILRDAAIGAVAKELATKDVKAALDLIKKLGKRGRSGTWKNGIPQGPYSAIAEAWAKTDPQAAAKAVVHFPWCAPREGAYLALGREWAKRDSKAASQWAEKVPPTRERWRGMVREAARLGVGYGLLTKDVKAAAEYAKKVNDVGLYAAVVQELAKRDPRAAIKYAEKHITRKARPLLSGRPEFTRTMADEALQFAYERIAEEWAKKDVKAALAWAKGGHRWPAKRNDPRLVRAVARVVAESDPDAALALVEKLKDKLDGRRISDAILQAQTLSAVAVAKAKKDPEAAAKIAVGMKDYWGWKRRTLAAVAREWSKKTPNAAAEWVLKLNPGHDRARAVQALTAEWARTSPRQAQAWAEGLKDAHDAANAFCGLAKGMAPSQAGTVN